MLLPRYRIKSISQGQWKNYASLESSWETKQHFIEKTMPRKLMVRDLNWFYPGLDVLNRILIMLTAALFSLKNQREVQDFVRREAMLGSKIYIDLHISILSDLCHYFVLWSEQN